MSIFHVCSECGESVIDYCPAHPRAQIDSVVDESNVIRIVHHIHEGIRPGGGRKVADSVFRTTPRNLLLAVRQARVRHRDNRESYGNVGCGCTALVINTREYPLERFSDIENTKDAKKFLDLFNAFIHPKK